VFILPVGISAILIIYGRFYHRSRWGSWIAVAGYALLAVTAVVALVLGN